VIDFGQFDSEILHNDTVKMHTSHNAHNCTYYNPPKN